MPSRTLGRGTSGFLSQADDLGPIIYLAEPLQLVGHALGRDPEPRHLNVMTLVVTFVLSLPSTMAAGPLCSDRGSGGDIRQLKTTAGCG